MFLQYERVDGFQCQAVQFMGGGEVEPKHIFDILCVLNDAELEAIHVKEEITDEWFLNEDDEPEQKIIGEHIKTQANNDHLWIGDYVVKRDGAIYIMDGQIFEAIWTLSITDNVDEWEWVLNKRLPYQKRSGYWQHKHNEDIVSMDGGRSYFHLSERPRYAPYGQLHQSAPKIGV
jgi:hypothetical protein